MSCLTEEISDGHYHLLQAPDTYAQYGIRHIATERLAQMVLLP
jgi:hypothetical protein